MESTKDNNDKQMNEVSKLFEADDTVTLPSQYGNIEKIKTKMTPTENFP